MMLGLDVDVKYVLQMHSQPNVKIVYNHSRA